MTGKPKAWFDENYVLRFRDDITVSEGLELQEMMRAAFNAGMLNMAEQRVFKRWYDRASIGARLLYWKRLGEQRAHAPP